jgi:hypothetical protein
MSSLTPQFSSTFLGQASSPLPALRSNLVDGMATRRVGFDLCEGEILLGLVTA